MRVKREIKRGIYMWEVIMPGKWFGAKYIGQSIDILDRQDNHKWDLKADRHHNKKLQNFIKKYGIQAFNISILLECSEKELNFWEKWFIKSFNTYKTKLGFNMTEGGDEGSHNFTKCRLQNMYTNEIVEYPSVKSFCEKYNIEHNSRVSEVLSKKSRFVGDWFNPDGNWRPKIYTLIDPNGDIYSFPNVKLLSFCEKYNLYQACVIGLVKGDTMTHRGWTRPTGRKEPNYTFALDFSFISPEGKIFKGRNIDEFAREQNLSGRQLRAVLHGTIKQTAGWRKYNEGDIPESFVFKKYSYQVIDPNGREFICNNLHKFALENGLCPKGLQNVYKGRRAHCKGWKVLNNII